VANLAITERTDRAVTGLEAMLSDV